MDWEAHFAQRPFQPYTRGYSLATCVLVVAKSRIEGAWCAYCNDVPGRNHQDEQQGVLDHGDKLGEEVARAMFTEFEGVPYSG